MPRRGLPPPADGRRHRRARRRGDGSALPRARAVEAGVALRGGRPRLLPLGGLLVSVRIRRGASPAGLPALPQALLHGMPRSALAAAAVPQFLRATTRRLAAPRPPLRRRAKRPTTPASDARRTRRTTRTAGCRGWPLADGGRRARNARRVRACTRDSDASSRLRTRIGQPVRNGAARRHPASQTWVERESGCNAMRCVCLQRFCYACGMKTGSGPGGRGDCTCTDPGTLQVHAIHAADPEPRGAAGRRAALAALSNSRSPEG